MPERVVAKFRCTEMTQRLEGYGSDKYVYSYTFYPVTGGSEENKEFWKYTPSGKLELTSINSDLFVIGAEYYLDFQMALEGTEKIPG